MKQHSALIAMLIFVIAPSYAEVAPRMNDMELGGRFFSKDANCEAIDFNVNFSDGAYKAIVKDAPKSLVMGTNSPDSIELRLGSGSCQIAVSIKPIR